MINDIINIGSKALHFGNAIELDKILPLIPSNIIVMGNVNPAGQFKNGTPQSITEETNAISRRLN